jgi:hypothetical protein
VEVMNPEPPGLNGLIELEAKSNESKDSRHRRVRVQENREQSNVIRTTPKDAERS